MNGQDDEHDPEKSVNAYNTLKDWGMQMLVGCVTSKPCIAVAAESSNDNPVSYTHLDVYKRQAGRCAGAAGQPQSGY